MLRRIAMGSVEMGIAYLLLIVQNSIGLIDFVYRPVGPKPCRLLIFFNGHRQKCQFTKILTGEVIETVEFSSINCI